jgi:hypothetical protein
MLVGDHVQVIALLSYPGIVVPDFVRTLPPAAAPEPPAQPVVLLDYGYGLARPTDDLKLDDRGITATLIFDGVDHATFVPWGAIIAMQRHDHTFVAGFEVAEPVAAEPEPPKRAGLKAV